MSFYTVEYSGIDSVGLFFKPRKTCTNCCCGGFANTCADRWWCGTKGEPPVHACISPTVFFLAGVRANQNMGTAKVPAREKILHSFSSWLNLIHRCRPPHPTHRHPVQAAPPIHHWPRFIHTWYVVLVMLLGNSNITYRTTQLFITIPDPLVYLANGCVSPPPPFCPGHVGSKFQRLRICSHTACICRFN